MTTSAKAIKLLKYLLRFSSDNLVKSECNSKKIVTKFKGLRPDHVKPIQERQSLHPRGREAVRTPSHPKMQESPDFFFLALREFPDTTAETNEVLRIQTESDKPIVFSKIDFEKCYFALARAIGEFDSHIEDMNYLDDTDVIWKDPKELFYSIEDALFKLDPVFGLTHLKSILDSDFENKLNQSGFIKRYYETRQKTLESEKINAAIEKMTKSSQREERSVQRMIRMYREESRFSQANLEPVTRGILKQMEDHVRLNLNYIYGNFQSAVSSFDFTIDDPDILKWVTPELSIYDTTHHRTRTPLRVNYKNCKMFIRLCPDTELRRNLFKAVNRLCSPAGNQKYDSYTEFENIRLARRKISDGFKARNYFDLRRGSAHVQTKDFVVKTWAKLNEENLETFKMRLYELADFASGSKDVGYDGEIQEADFEYWAHKFGQKNLLGCTEKLLEMNFPVDKVFDGMIKFLKDYFDIHLKEVSRDKSAHWHKDVRMFRVSYKDRDIGAFYYDPYANSEAHESNTIQGIRKNTHGETFMSQNDIKSLFYAIGLTIQQLLCNEPFYELNIRGPFKADTDRILPNLFVTWLWTDPRILQSCSYKKESGQQMSLDEINRILSYITHFNCFRSADGLYKSHLDLELNTSVVEAKKIAPELYSIYKPFAYDTTTYHYCSDMNLIAVNCGMHYGELLSKILATDCFKTYQAPEDVASFEGELIRQASDKIISTIYETDTDIELTERLNGITGNGFDFTQPSLGVL